MCLTLTRFNQQKMHKEKEEASEYLFSFLKKSTFNYQELMKVTRQISPLQIFKGRVKEFQEEPNEFPHKQLVLEFVHFEGFCRSLWTPSVDWRKKGCVKWGESALVDKERKQHNPSSKHPPKSPSSSSYLRGCGWFPAISPLSSNSDHLSDEWRQIEKF